MLGDRDPFAACGAARPTFPHRSSSPPKCFMTDTEAKQAAAEPAPDEATPPPPPEPWTPARVSEWNAYYDVYVAAFVLALAFLGSANKIQSATSGLWSQLQAGRQIVAAGSPIGLDAGTLAGEGHRWVNIPWLFEVIHFGIFQTVAPLAPPPDPALPTPPGVRGDQIAAGALVALDALIRALTAYLLLGLRRKGPGLWWTALCVTMALGVTLSPEPVESVRPRRPAGRRCRRRPPALGDPTRRDRGRGHGHPGNLGAAVPGGRSCSCSTRRSTWARPVGPTP